VDRGFALAILSLVLGAFGIYFGFGLGSQLAEKATSKKAYWKLNAAVYAVGIAVSAVVWATGLVILVFVTIGALAGAIAGLRMGYGEAVGPWKAHDRFMNLHPDDKPRRAPRKIRWPWQKEEKKGWADIRPEDEAPSDEPELMSVSGPAQDRKTRKSKNG
jgi:hypothetical protein